MILFQVAGDGSRVYLSDPGMAVIPFVVALQDEALQQGEWHNNSMTGNCGHLRQGQRTHFVSAVGFVIVTSISHLTTEPRSSILARVLPRSASLDPFFSGKINHERLRVSPK